MAQNLSYDLGLDIGIASVGWCVLGQSRIVDLGVRAFDKAETPDGESLNLARRMARLLRRRLRRRAWRLLKVSRLLKREGLIDDGEFFKKHHPFTQSLWVLRVEALDRGLSAEEWARVIYHLCKHRGFWFASKRDAATTEGAVKKGLEATRQLLLDKGYRTAAEMMLAEFPNNQRNKRGDYGQSLSRELLCNELAELFKRQRELGNPFASSQLETLILDPKSGLFWQQKPALSGSAMLDLVGKCTFEKKEFRAAKRSYSAERFVWLTRLNNLRISLDGESRALTAAERIAVLDLPYELASVKYKQLKAKLVKLGFCSEDIRFTGLNYRDGGKDPEETKLIELSGWHDLRKALEGAGLKTEWQGLATQPALLDKITTILSVFKTDEEISEQLTQLGLSEPVIACLQMVSFTDFIRLSLKALAGILPGMESGLRYDQACEAAGYHHSQLVTNTGSRYLPALDEEAPNNPVVKRALNQARKVVNAIIREYGSPQQVHIEMARDLSRPLDERYKIEKEQKSYQEMREKERKDFAETFGYAPKAKDFEKWLLYREQDGKCAYSLQSLDLNRLFENGYAEVDHALPYSRSFDDSKNNKVLALTRENRDKGNRTPYEYFDGASNSHRWALFESFVKANPKYRHAKRERLLRKSFSKEDAAGFKERNLNDTRYICRYFKNFVEQHLALHGDSEAKRCVVVSGQLTSFLRARWGLIKVRESSDRHHALDAAVVAACSHGMVKRLSDYARRKELEQVRDGFVDVETGEVTDITALRKLENHFPRPWAHFEHELCLRLGIDRNTGAVLPADHLPLQHEHLIALGYSAAELAQSPPVFVSRAPKRRNGGAAHKETIYSKAPTYENPNRVTQKIALTSLKLADLDRLVEPHRNEKLYAAIRERLEAFGGKADKAFAQPFYKPGKNAEQGPLVRTVTVEIENLTGIPLRGGIAKNDSMVRVDIFTKAGKFYPVPVYVHHRVAKVLPDRAVVAGKDEAEWTLIDESFVFCFSLYPNDLVTVSFKGKPAITGYYAGLDRATGAISLWAHDRNKAEGKDGLIRSIGVKTALKLERFNVDVLGRVYLAPAEVRRGLA